MCTVSVRAGVASVDRLESVRARVSVRLGVAHVALAENGGAKQKRLRRRTRAPSKCKERPTISGRTWQWNTHQIPEWNRNNTNPFHSGSHGQEDPTPPPWPSFAKGPSWFAQLQTQLPLTPRWGWGIREGGRGGESCFQESQPSTREVEIKHTFLRAGISGFDDLPPLTPTD